MVIKEEHQQVVRLLRDTVTLLCKNGLKYKNKIDVEGLIGVTVDDEDVFLVSIKDAVADGTESNKDSSRSKDRGTSKRRRDKSDVINLTDDDDNCRRSKKSRGGDDVIVVREEPMSPSHRIAAKAARNQMYGRNAQGMLQRGANSLTQIRPRFPPQQYYGRGGQFTGRGTYPFRTPTSSPGRQYYPQMARGAMNQQQMQSQYMARMQYMGPGRPPLNQQMQMNQMNQTQPGQFALSGMNAQQPMPGQPFVNAAAGSPAQLSQVSNANQNQTVVPTSVVPVTQSNAPEIMQQTVNVVQPEPSSSQSETETTTSTFPAPDLNNGQPQEPAVSSEPFPAGLVLATQITPVTESENTTTTPGFSPLSEPPREASDQSDNNGVVRDSRADLEQLQASLEELQASINPEQVQATEKTEPDTSQTEQQVTPPVTVTQHPQDSPASQAGSSYSQTSTSQTDGDAHSEASFGMPSPGLPGQSAQSKPKKRGRGRPPKSSHGTESNETPATPSETRRSSRLEQVANSVSYNEGDSEDEEELEKSPFENPPESTDPPPEAPSTPERPTESPTNNKDDKSKITTLPENEIEEAITQSVLGTVKQVANDTVKQELEREPDEQEQIDPSIIQLAVFKMMGPIVALNAIEEKLGVSKEIVRVALEAMTYPDHATSYVGQIVTITGDVDIFFKCPPQCLHPDALIPYNMETGIYKNFYCQVPEDTKEILTPWYTYVESMVVKCPYSYTMFPLDHLGLDEKEVRRLVKLKGKLEEINQMKAGAPKKN